MNICMDILKLLLLVILCLRSLCEAVPLPKDGSNRELHTVHVENISPPLGQKAVLRCHAPHNIPVIGVKWIRPDLEKKYVVYWRDGRMDPGNQHPSFKNRTEMQASQINDGDLSVVLMNVSSTDNGRYEAFMKIKTNSIVETKPICVVNLMTAPDALAGDKHTEEKKPQDKKIGVYRNRYGYLGSLVFFFFVGILNCVVQKCRKESDKTVAYQAVGQEYVQIPNTTENTIETPVMRAASQDHGSQISTQAAMIM